MTSELEETIRALDDESKEIKERALKEKAPSGFEQKEHLVKIVYIK